MIQRLSNVIHDVLYEETGKSFAAPVTKAIAECVVLAMREPTQEMIYSPHVEPTLTLVWQGMIDRALK